MISAEIYSRAIHMKKPISATIDAELIRWIEKELQDRKKYRNKSHLIEIALDLLKNQK